MKTWFTSLNGALTLSALSLLTFIGYTLTEMRYFLEKWIPGDAAVMIEVLAVMLIVGGWLRALFVASRGGRGGWTALLALSGFATLVAVYDLQYVTPSMHWPEMTTIFAMLGLSLLALAALWVQRRQGKSV